MPNTDTQNLFREKLAKIDKRFHQALFHFMQTGELDPEFEKYADQNTECLELIDELLAAEGSIIRGLVAQLGDLPQATQGAPAQANEYTH